MNENIKVIASFGAANGGFELIWSLKRDIDKEYGEGTTYLDAISLEHHNLTNYTWNDDLGIWKMSNQAWAELFSDAMGRSKCIIFCITKEWLNSFYCWQEFLWFIEHKEIVPIFLLTQEAMDIINTRGHRILENPLGGEGLAQSYPLLLDYLSAHLYLIMDNEDAPGEYTWNVDGTEIRYEYNTKYSLNRNSVETILDGIHEILT